jgi:hypothetical protein
LGAEYLEHCLGFVEWGYLYFINIVLDYKPCVIEVLERPLYGLLPRLGW